MTRTWSNWKIFGISVLLALLLTPLIAPYYFKVFQSYGGGLLGFPGEWESYPLTFFLLSVFFLSFFYISFSVKFKLSTFVYLIIVPVLFSAPAGDDRAASGGILIAVGLALGALFKKKVLKKI